MALLTFTGAVKKDPAIDRWIDGHPNDIAALARAWFTHLRACGADVRELLHDGCATVCVRDAPFAYVGAYKAHISVGFFQGATLPDPAGLMEGTGKLMRHVKIRPGRSVDRLALEALIDAAYRDILSKLDAAP